MWINTIILLKYVGIIAYFLTFGFVDESAKCIINYKNSKGKMKLEFN